MRPRLEVSTWSECRAWDCGTTNACLRPAVGHHTAIHKTCSNHLSKTFLLSRTDAIPTMAKTEKLAKAGRAVTNWVFKRQKFCCCLPVRFGAGIMSFLTLLFAGLLAVILWFEVASACSDVSQISYQQQAYIRLPPRVQLTISCRTA